MKTVRLIGIAGICQGCGTTHLAILTANCLAGWMQRRAALIDWSGHGDFAAIEALMASGREKNGKTSARGYSLLDVDYYREGTPGILAACMEGPYDDVVIDFGQLQSGIREDWLRCGTKILTASLSEWKLGVFLEFLEREMRPGSGWIYAAAFGSEDTRKRMERRFGISLKRIPLSVDAFSVDSRVKDWLEGILK